MQRQYSGDDEDWGTKMDDIDVSTREIMPGTAVSSFNSGTEELDPVNDLKRRLTTWGK